MKIILSPVRMDSDVTLSLVKTGDTLTVNGEDFDFSPIGNGDTLPMKAINSTWFDKDVERVDGELVISIILPNPWNYSPEQAFPEPIVVNTDGFIELPKPLTIEEEEAPLEPAPEEEVIDEQ